MADTPRSGHPLYVRPQARSGSGHDERVFHSTASGHAGRVFAVRLAWGDAGVGGCTASDDSGVGAAGVCERSDARGHWRRGCNVLGTHDPGLYGPRDGLSPAGRGGRRSDLYHVEGVGRGTAHGPSTGVLSVVSDRAKALIQLAEQGLECLSMHDFFHVAHEIVKSYSLAMGQRWRHAQQELTKATEALARRQGVLQAAQAPHEARALVQARQAEVTRSAEAHHSYRGHLESLSLTLHPFRLSGSTPQTSAQVKSQLMAAVEAIEALARDHQLPARHDAMTRVRKQIPALAACRKELFDRRLRCIVHLAHEQKIQNRRLRSHPQFHRHVA